MKTSELQSYLRSQKFLSGLGLSAGTQISLAPLGQGEYNQNFLFWHPLTGQKLVLRVNTGSQMHLADQIEYEFFALQELETSGRTPRPLFCDGTKSKQAQGILVMEWLPGRPLNYQTDMAAAAEILADIHSVPVRPDTKLLRPANPLLSIYGECLEMAAQYFHWEQADGTVCGLLESMIREGARLTENEAGDAPRCIVNTELNSGNFLINRPGQVSYLIDWEKPILSEPAQDLAHFLAPTTTLWKTETALTAEEIHDFADSYCKAARERIDTKDAMARLPLFFAMTCLRGVTWCAMARVEYERPDRPLKNGDTFRKICRYLQPDFLEHIQDSCIRKNFLKAD